MSSSPNFDHPFWKFSLAVYGAPGVADECLGLQERLQLDVNLLLFAAYVGAAEGLRLELKDISVAADAVATWHGEIVRGLRQARRALKPFATASENSLHAASAALRATVKAAELEAEKIEQAILWDWSRKHIVAAHRDDPRMALTANLRTLMTFYGVPAGQTEPAKVAPRLFGAAMAYVGFSL